MTGQKLKNVGRSEVLLGLLIVAAIIVAAALLGGVITYFIFNTLGVAAWLGLGHLSYWASVGLSILIGTVSPSAKR